MIKFAHISSVTSALAALTLVAIAGSASAAVTVLDLTGYQSFDTEFPGTLNTQTTLTLEPNAQVTSITFSNLSIQLSNGSYGSEFTISTNQSSNTGDAGTFWDYRPFSAATSAAPTTLGPISGAFTSPSNQFASGPFTLLADGKLLLYVYETFNDAGTAVDASVVSGTLTITTTPVPEPSTWAMALGGLGSLVLLQRPQRSRLAWRDRWGLGPVGMVK